VLLVLPQNLMMHSISPTENFHSQRLITFWINFNSPAQIWSSIWVQGAVESSYWPPFAAFPHEESNVFQA
jgi:hypothetical protein